MSNEHLSADLLQALLDGELPSRAVARAEAHLAGCARCSVELDAWRLLLEDLEALPMPVPNEGFADRVMSRVALPDPFAGAHVAPELLQDYLDGTLGAKRGARVETHLAACTSCSEEADAWSAVLARLEDLDRFAPSHGFARSVLSEVRLPERMALVARIRARLAGLVGSTADHVQAGRLQDFVEGLLPARQMARVQVHLDDCPDCSAEATVWRTIAQRLGTLARYEPGVGFADRVVAAVRVAAPSRALAWSAVPTRALALARRFLPKTREAWAALSGMAVTPAVTLGLVLYAVFSHPTLTPSALASFVWWQVADLASAGWAATSAALLQSAEVFGLYSVFEALVAAPIVVAGGVLLYSLVSAVALRVLYRNVIANRPLDRGYVRVSTS